MWRRNDTSLSITDLRLVTGSSGHFLMGSPLGRETSASRTTHIDLLREFGTSLRSSHLKKIESEIWELRPEYGGTEYRLFFGIHGDSFVFTHAIVKKRQKTARSDVELAQRRFDEWKGRNL